MGPKIDPGFSSRGFEIDVVSELIKFRGIDISI